MFLCFYSFTAMYSSLQVAKLHTFLVNFANCKLSLWDSAKKKYIISSITVFPLLLGLFLLQIYSRKLEITKVFETQDYKLQ